MGVKRKQPPVTGSSSGTHPFIPFSSSTNLGPGVRRSGTRARARSEQEHPASTLSVQPSPARPRRTSPVEQEDPSGILEYVGYSANNIGVDVTGLTQPTEGLSVVSRPSILSDDPRHVRFRSLLNQFLIEGQFEEKKCCALFVDRDRQCRLLQYHNNLTDGLEKLASVIMGCLILANEDISEFKDYINGPRKALNAFVKGREKIGAISYYFIDFIMRKTNNNQQLNKLKTFCRTGMTNLWKPSSFTALNWSRSTLRKL